MHNEPCSAARERFEFPENLRIFALISGAHYTDRATALKHGDSLLLYPLISGG